ncbi:hypothetical protein HDV02_001603 [Globomyces sp. JEL0801]|nr:hypothetical protein HDV02_001603 [Globomyces sp. JEL0801]
MTLNIDDWNQKLAEKTPKDIIQWAINTFPVGLYQTTSFGITGMAIMHINHQISNHQVPIIFIDTLHNFDETLKLKSKAIEKYNADIHVYKPNGCNTREEFIATHGEKLWETNADLYDYVVKAEPAHRAYTELNARAVFTGRRRSQGADRSTLKVLELDNSISPPLIKINVLAYWDYDTVWDFISREQVPYNELLDKGYKSVGDYHSTQPIAEGEDERAGRWKGQEKTECGLHKDYFKLKIAAKKEAK